MKTARLMVALTSRNLNQNTTEGRSSKPSTVNPGETKRGVARTLRRTSRRWTVSTVLTGDILRRKTRKPAHWIPQQIWWPPRIALYPPGRDHGWWEAAGAEYMPRWTRTRRRLRNRYFSLTLPLSVSLCLSLSLCLSRSLSTFNIFRC